MMAEEPSGGIEKDAATTDTAASTGRGAMVASSGIGQLTKMLNDHMAMMKHKNEWVDRFINNFSNSALLKDAKIKAVETETQILTNIMNDIMEMSTFLNNIIKIENTFNALYEPHKKEQEAARSKYAPNIAKYEVKPKVNSEVGSFVELMFGGQTVHSGSFQKWLDKVNKICAEKDIKVLSNSGAHCKKIERAFYKAFYVYSSDDNNQGFKEMTDVIRCSIVFDDFGNLYKAYNVIEETAEKDIPGGILRLKDRFNPKLMPFGYRDLLINVYCPGCKIVCEMQLHHVLFYKLKKISHRMYKKARLFEREGYNAAYDYATKYLRPKIGDKQYEVTGDDITKDDEKEKEEEEEVDFRMLLKSWKLDKYADKMEEEGWDDPIDWKDITDDDFKDDLNFSKGHIKKFQRKYKEWQNEYEQKKAAKKGGGGGGGDTQNNAMLEAQKKLLEEQKALELKQKQMMEEQEKKYKEELEKLKQSNSNQWETKVFVYQSDFDIHGILFGLGTEWGQITWQNPALTGKVIMRSSGVKADSKPLSSLCGRDDIRFICTVQANSWFSVDFLELRICPTNYSLKHYVSWDIEALRNWAFEGSIDGINWTLIKKHTNDPKLTGKACKASWNVNCQYYFNQFRIRMTGPNDNNHNYLCCSGFELYGSVKRGNAAKGLTKPIPTTTTEEKDENISQKAVITNPNDGKIFEYKSDFDTNGIIYWLGTNRGTEAWKNPIDRGIVKITSVKLASNCADIKYILQNKGAVRIATDNIQRGWISIDLNDVYIKPTCYSLRHYISWDTEALRTWELHASNGCRPGAQPQWLILSKHSNDTSLNKKGASKTWDIAAIATDEAFNKFRLVLTGVNSNQHWYLACSGFEIYGQVLYKIPQYVAPSKPIDLGGDEMKFEYEYDFDENGILYYLGTYAGTQNWSNPGIAGTIGVSASSLGPNSERIGSFCGRKAVQCLTKDEKNADMLLNLKDIKMKVSHYSLRHYSSSDTECLRDWNFEASTDGANWVIIKSHIKDTSLNKKGSTKTWEVNNNGWFQYFRIIITGPNSNGHNNLCCSGIELYGIAAGGFVSNPPIYQKKSDPDPPHKIFKYVGVDMDESGLLYYMGTMNKTQKWTNPHTIGLCAVSASALVDDSESIIHFCGRSAVRCITKDNERADMMINLKDIRIKLTHYTLRHYISWDSEALRNWDLESSHDGKAWVKIKQHKNDESLKQKGQAFTWKVDECREYYQYFRIIITGANSNNHNNLACSGIEFYGIAAGGIIKNPIKLAPPPPPPYRKFEYESDFDTNGIIYWLGTNGGSEEWRNPSSINPPIITATSSAIVADSEAISSICGRSLVRCVTQDKVNAWWLLNFNTMRIRPTHYTLKHYSSWDTECLRDWKLEGKNPDGKWRLISSHSNDTSLQKKGGTMTFKVDTKEFFQQISVMMTGKNSNGHWYLACSGVEFYGIVAGGMVNDTNSNLDFLSDYEDYEDQKEGDDDDDDDDDDNKELEPGQGIVKPLGKQIVIELDGKCDIEETENGFKISATSKFPSVRGNFNLKKGRWFYEIQLLTDKCMQIGFADCGFIANESKGEGVGDHSCSWSYDGWRQKKWNGNKSAARYGGNIKWRNGDIIGCYIDCDEGIIGFIVNGNDLGVAFNNIKFKGKGNVYPAVTLQGGNADKQSLIFIFDGEHFKYGNNLGYNAINTFHYFKKPILWTSQLIGITDGGGNNGNYSESEYKYISPGYVALTGIAFGDNKYFDELSIVIRRVYYKLNDNSETDQVINYEAGLPVHGVVNIKRKTLSRSSDEFCNEIEIFYGCNDNDGNDQQKGLNSIRGIIFKSNKGKETKVGSFINSKTNKEWNKKIIKPPNTKYAICGFQGTHHYVLKNIKFIFVSM